MRRTPGARQAVARQLRQVGQPARRAVRRARGDEAPRVGAVAAPARRPAARRRRPRSAAARCTGPSQADTCAGSQRAAAHSAASAASTTPPARPRQPACAAATARPPGAASSTGRQSATCTMQATPGSSVQAASACGGSAAGSRGAGAHHACAVHLAQPHRLRAGQRATKRRRFSATARRIVADRHAQVQAVPGRRADAAGARAHQRADTRRQRPTAASSMPAAAAAAQKASGQASGRVFSKASSCMQASNTRITCGTWSVRHLKRCALKICGTSTQSASVGVSPWQ